MKIIRTSSFDKLSEKKEWDPNPWAVCTDSVGREDKEKYERCIQKIKKQQEKKDTSLPKEYRTEWSPEDDFDERINEEFSGEADKRKDRDLGIKWEQAVKKQREKMKKEPAYAKSNKKNKKQEPEDMVKPFPR